MSIRPFEASRRFGGKSAPTPRCYSAMANALVFLFAVPLANAVAQQPVTASQLPATPKPIAPSIPAVIEDPENELSLCKREIAAATEPILLGYSKELALLRTKIQATGELKKALAVVDEINRFAKANTLKSADIPWFPVSSELADLQKSFVSKIKAAEAIIADRHVATLKEFVRTKTKQGNLNAAVAADTVIAKMTSLFHTGGNVTQGWHTPLPPYPLIAKSARIQGSGAVRISTDSSGKVTSVVIARPINPILDAHTRSFALANWKGPPDSTRTVPVSYQLR